jgi:hypothetical protein
MNDLVSLVDEHDVTDLAPDGGTWRGINNGRHSYAALVVWKMENEERSPKCEEFARRLVASHNICQGVSIGDLEGIEPYALSAFMAVSKNYVETSDKNNKRIKTLEKLLIDLLVEPSDSVKLNAALYLLESRK